MNQERRSLRVGAAAICCAMILRLVGGGFFNPLLQILRQPRTASFLIYLETGRAIPRERLQALLAEPSEPAPSEPASPETTPSAPPETVPPETVPPTQPPETVPPAQDVPVFTAADAALISTKVDGPALPDVAAMLQTELRWDLTADGPTVLILHTHASESYAQRGETYEESASYHTLDEAHNMVSVGDRLTELLEAGGISVLHDRAIHDYPSYNGSYEDARGAIQDYLAQYPTIRLILDLHRDAAEDGNGNQIAPTAQLSGGEAAQLMLVIGSSAGGLSYPNWQQNLTLAVKLHAMLERQAPGICRHLHLTSQRYNQDLSPNALLIEVGAAGNTRQQALLAMEPLAQAILALAHGANP